MNAQRLRTRLILVAALFAAPAWLTACSAARERNPDVAPTQTPIRLIEASADSAQLAVLVYKNAGCECCLRWAEHLRQNGFAVTVVEKQLAELNAVKTRLGVPTELRSCHTAIVNGYLIEGHVPADLVRRFVTEAPEVVGLTTRPNMAPGMPGMEMEDVEPQPYTVVTFDEAGETMLYARRGPTEKP